MEQGIKNCICYKLLDGKGKICLVLPIVFFLINLLSFSALSQTNEKSGRGTALTDSSQYYVQEIIGSKIPVFTEFWAVWCMPCKMLTPVISQIKDEYRGKIKILKINVDRNRSLATYFRVNSIPSVFIIKNKIVVQRIMGVQPKSAYITALNEVLHKDNDTTDNAGNTDSTDSKEM